MPAFGLAYLFREDELFTIYELKLGDVPYVYSIIPLSQTANTPIFELSYATGVRGNQTSSVENYKKYLNTLAENFVKNIGE